MERKQKAVRIQYGTRYYRYCIWQYYCDFSRFSLYNLGTWGTDVPPTPVMPRTLADGAAAGASAVGCVRDATTATTDHATRSGSRCALRQRSPEHDEFGAKSSKGI